MSLPNIVIPGAPKAGTTSVAAILNQHPDVFVPSIKEPRFFIAEEILKLPDNDPLKKYLISSSVLDYKKYDVLYKQEAKFKIDPSIQYLFYYKSTTEKIKEYLGNPYIILILRNPINRAISNFTFNRTLDKCSTLIEAIDDELQGKRAELNSFMHYYGQGLYYEQTKYYKENFTNVKVMFYEDFAKDNLKFINSILDFVGASHLTEIKKLPNLNTSADLTLLGKLVIGRYSLFNALYRNVLPLFFSKGDLFDKKLKLTAKYSKKDTNKITLSDQEREYIKSLYKDNVQKLMELLGITECPWKEFK